MMSLKSKTGIEAIDAALDGGLRAGSFCLINGPAMSGRELLAQQLFFSGLASEEAGTYITTRNFADDIVNQMAEKMMYITSYEDKYIFIDSYTVQSDPTVKDTATVRYVPSVADFAKMSNTIVTSLGEFLGKGIYQQRLVFDSVDTVMMYVSPAGVYRFLSYLRAKMKAFKALSFFLLQPDLHDEKDVKTILQLADVLIDLDPSKEQMTIAQSSTPKLSLGYKIGDKGIDVWKMG